MKKLMIGVMMAMAAGGVMAAASFSYQGVLKNATGTACITGTTTIVFRLYEKPADDAVLWARMQTVQLNDGGLFNVELSDTSGSALTGKGVPTNSLDSVFSDYLGQGKGLYIGLTVEPSTGEIRPRQKLLPVPAASYALDVAQASANFTVNGTLFAQHGITVPTNGVVELSGGLKVSAGDLSLSNCKMQLGHGVTIEQNGSPVGFVPKGVIVMWSGSADAIPDGWALCDGSGDTPDLRGRFIVGASKKKTDKGKGVDVGYAVADTGGTNSVALAKDQMPSHYHLHFGDDHLDYKAQVEYRTGGYDAESDNSGNAGWFRTSSAGGDPATGNTVPHENRPPYYALCFIMKK